MNTIRILVGCALSFGLVACGGSSGGGSSGPNPNATLSAGQYDANLETNCGGERDTDEGNGTITRSGDMYTISIPGIGDLGPAELVDGRIEIPSFSYFDSEDGADIDVAGFTLNLTADNRLSGRFNFDWDDGDDQCSGSGSISIFPS